MRTTSEALVRAYAGWAAQNLRTRVLTLGCSGTVALAGGAAPAAAAPFPVHLGFSDGSAPVNGFVCVGAGCFEAHAVGQALAPGSVFTAGPGHAVIEAAPGAVVEAGYTHGYRVDPAFGVYWFRAVAGEGLAFTVPRLLTPGSDPGMEEAELQFLELVNRTRVASGLAPVDAEPRLFAAAASHTDWMVRTGIQGHVGEHGSTPQTRPEEFGTAVYGGGEIAYLDGGTAEAALEGFLNSPPHRVVVLDPAVRFIGIGNEGDAWSALLVTALGPEPAWTAPAADPTALGTPAAPLAPPSPPAPLAVTPAPIRPRAGGRANAASEPRLSLTGVTFVRGAARLPRRRVLVFRATGDTAARFSARLDGRLVRGTGIKTYRVRIPARAAVGSHTLTVSATTAGGRSTLRFEIRAGRLMRPAP